MKASVQTGFHGGLGRKGSWRAPFVFQAMDKTKKSLELMR